MPDVIDAPLLATTFDDGYTPTSGVDRSYFRLSGLSLNPWRWSLGASSMSGGVEVSAHARGATGGSGLRISASHGPYSTVEEGSPAPLHHHTHLNQAHRRYYHYQPQQPQRQHLSTLENVSHHRRSPLHLLNTRQTTKGTRGVGRCSVTLSTSAAAGAAEPAMRANERWVLLNKETFQEIFDATLYQMTQGPSELLGASTEDSRKLSSTSSAASDRDVEDGVGSPPSPTTPEGLRLTKQALQMAPGSMSRCANRKRSPSNNGDEKSEGTTHNFLQAPPVTAMAPTESAKTNTALNDITNDQPAHRYSPAISVSSAISSSSPSTSGPSSPRVTSPPAIVAPPTIHSPLRTLLPPEIDRENNEPLDLSNKRSPLSTSTTDSTPHEQTLLPQQCPDSDNKYGGHQEEPSERVNSPGAHAGGGVTGEGRGSPVLPASPNVTPTTGTDQHTQLPAAPPAAQVGPNGSPLGGVRAEDGSVPNDRRAPSPGRAVVRGEHHGVVGGCSPTHNHHHHHNLPSPPVAAAAAAQHTDRSLGSIVGGALGGGGGGGRSVSNTTDTPVSSADSSSSSSSRFINTTSCSSRIQSSSPHSSPRTLSDQESQEKGQQTRQTLTPSPTTNISAVADESGLAASAVTTTSASVTSRPSVTSSEGGNVMKPASENWMPLNKATVYDLVEEVMFSLGEDEEQEKVALKDSSNNHHRTISPSGGVLPRQLSQKQQSQQSKYRAIPSYNNNNVNNNTLCLKRSHGDMETEGRSQSHRSSPSLLLEKVPSQGQTNEQRSRRADDKALSAAGSLRPAVSSTKSQLRDHLSARSQQGRGTSVCGRIPNPHQFDYEPDQGSRGNVNNMSVLDGGGQHRRSPVRGSLCFPTTDSSNFSSTSPTSKAKQQQQQQQQQQQCWMALSKNVVYNIVDSAMRNSETEEEGEDEEKEENTGQVGALTDLRSEVKGTDPSEKTLIVNREGSTESDSNSSNNSDSHSYTEKIPSPKSDTDNRDNNLSNLQAINDSTPQNSQQQQQQLKSCAKRRHCDTTISVEVGKEEGETTAKKCRNSTPTPPLVVSDPASPRKASIAEGLSEDKSTSSEGEASTLCQTIQQGPLTESGHQTMASQGKCVECKVVNTEDKTLSTGEKTIPYVLTNTLSGESLSKQVNHPSMCPGNQFCETKGDQFRSSANFSTQQIATTTSMASRRQCSSPRGAVSLVRRARANAPNTKAMTGNDVNNHFLTNMKHGLVPVPVSKHGLVPVSPTTDARSSPRLGWVAVSKIDVHNIVDSVVDSMIVGDMLPSSSSLSPGDDTEVAPSQSPVPSSPPSASASPPLPQSPREYKVTSPGPVPVHSTESCVRAISPQSPSPMERSKSPFPTSSLRSPHQTGTEAQASRGTPSPVPASPGSPRSPGGESLDRGNVDPKATKAFKWKSSLLMRVEEEKIDVTPEVNSTLSRRTPPVQSCIGSSKSRDQAHKSESRNLRSGKRSRKGASGSSSKLK